MAALGLFDDADVVVPDLQQIPDIHQLIVVLEKPEKFIRLLEGEKYVTISLVPQYLHECLSALQNLNLDLAIHVHAAIKNRLGWILTTRNFALGAAALDPRVFLHKIVSPAVNSDIWNWLAECVNEYAEVMEDDVPVDPLTPGAEQPSVQVISAALQSYRTVFENPQKSALLAAEHPLEYWRNQMNGPNAV